VAALEVRQAAEEVVEEEVMAVPLHLATLEVRLKEDQEEVCHPRDKVKVKVHRLRYRLVADRGLAVST